MKQFLLVSLLLLVAGFVSCLPEPEPSISFEKQLEIDTALIDAYLLEKDIDADIHASGIRYTHDIIGDGESPNVGDLVVIKFKSTLFNESIFLRDSLGLTVKLSGQTIEVLQLIIPLMKEGGHTTIYSPSGYCYGPRSVNGAPGNSNLIFEIELITIIRNAEDQLIADENIIDEYLTESNLNAEIHSSGIRFITQTEGSGQSPTTSDKVFVKYRGTNLNGQAFDQNIEGVQFSLQNLIQAWQIMIPTMKVGGKIKIYSPSRYCYGTAGNQTIPPNTILVFEIELIQIVQ